MIIVDKALEKRESENNPIRVAMVGAGFMGSGVVLQILKYVRGMRLVAIANRTISKAEKAYLQGDVKEIKRVDSVSKLEKCIAEDQYAITDDAKLLCQAQNIEVIIDATNAVEFGAHVATQAIGNGKHVVLMNAELDGTVGPILKVYADRAGVTYSGMDGDQPGVTMNLYRFVKSIGVKPVLCGNIKGLHDPYRNPTTQESFARKWGQNTYMVTSFADGSKISIEQALIANATGMHAAKRGMFGFTVPTGTSLNEAAKLFPLEELLEGNGVVDYVVGAEPSPGVFVLGTHDHPRQQHYLNLYKLGAGPLYCFYTPYHLCHFEVPLTVARAALFQDAAIAPIGGPQCDVVAVAKKDLKKDEVLDGIGGYASYGVLENYDVSAAEGLLPIGLIEGCRLKRSVSKDQVLTYADVEIPDGRLVDKLRAEQKVYFGG